MTENTREITHMCFHHLLIFAQPKKPAKVEPLFGVKNTSARLCLGLGQRCLKVLNTCGLFLGDLGPGTSLENTPIGPDPLGHS